MSRELLGRVSCPSGRLLVVDLGLLGMWSHAGPPLLPEWAATPETLKLARSALDYRVEGPDAVAATQLFGASSGWLYDRPPDFVETFAAAVAERGLVARLVPAPELIPHRQRVEQALQGPGAAGVVEFHGVWAPCVGALPVDRVMRVYGTPMGAGDFADRWRHVELEVGVEARASTECVGEVAVDCARIALVDVDALAEWQHDMPADGTADSQPHSHHDRMMSQMRSARSEAGTLSLGGTKMCAFASRWGDGLFPVEVDRAPDGSVVAVRIVLATAEAQENMRAVN